MRPRGRAARRGGRGQGAAQRRAAQGEGGAQPLPGGEAVSGSGALRVPLRVGEGDAEAQREA